MWEKTLLKECEITHCWVFHQCGQHGRWKFSLSLFFFFWHFPWTEWVSELQICSLVANPTYVRRILPFIFLWFIIFHDTQLIKSSAMAICGFFTETTHNSESIVCFICSFHTELFFLFWLTFMWIKPCNSDRTATDLLHMAIWRKLTSLWAGEGFHIKKKTDY